MITQKTEQDIIQYFKRNSDIMLTNVTNWQMSIEALMNNNDLEEENHTKLHRLASHLYKIEKILEKLNIKAKSENIRSDVQKFIAEYKIIIETAKQLFEKLNSVDVSFDVSAVADRQLIAKLNMVKILFDTTNNNQLVAWNNMYNNNLTPMQTLAENILHDIQIGDININEHISEHIHNDSFEYRHRNNSRTSSTSSNIGEDLVIAVHDGFLNHSSKTNSSTIQDSIQKILNYQNDGDFRFSSNARTQLYDLFDSKSYLDIVKASHRKMAQLKYTDKEKQQQYLELLEEQRINKQKEFINSLSAISSNQEVDAIEQVHNSVKELLTYGKETVENYTASLISFSNGDIALYQSRQHATNKVAEHYSDRYQNSHQDLTNIWITSAHIASHVKSDKYNTNFNILSSNADMLMKSNAQLELQQNEAFKSIMSLRNHNQNQPQHSQDKRENYETQLSAQAVKLSLRDFNNASKLESENIKKIVGNNGGIISQVKYAFGMSSTAQEGIDSVKKAIQQSVSRKEKMIQEAEALLITLGESPTKEIQELKKSLEQDKKYLNRLDEATNKLKKIPEVMSELIDGMHGFMDIVSSTLQTFGMNFILAPFMHFVEGVKKEYISNADTFYQVSMADSAFGISDGNTRMESGNTSLIFDTANKYGELTYGHMNKTEGAKFYMGMITNVGGPRNKEKSAVKQDYQEMTDKLLGYKELFGLPDSMMQSMTKIFYRDLQLGANSVMGKFASMQKVAQKNNVPIKQLMSTFISLRETARSSGVEADRFYDIFCNFVGFNGMILEDSAKLVKDMITASTSMGQNMSRSLLAATLLGEKGDVFQKLNKGILSHNSKGEVNADYIDTMTDRLFKEQELIQSLAGFETGAGDSNNAYSKQQFYNLIKEHEGFDDKEASILTQLVSSGKIEEVKKRLKSKLEDNGPEEEAKNFDKWSDSIKNCAEQFTPLQKMMGTYSVELNKIAQAIDKHFGALLDGGIMALIDVIKSLIDKFMQGLAVIGNIVQSPLGQAVVKSFQESPIVSTLVAGTTIKGLPKGVKALADSQNLGKAGRMSRATYELFSDSDEDGSDSQQPNQQPNTENGKSKEEEEKDFLTTMTTLFTSGEAKMHMKFSDFDEQIMKNGWVDTILKLSPAIVLGVESLTALSHMWVKHKFNNAKKKMQAQIKQLRDKQHALLKEKTRRQKELDKKYKNSRQSELFKDAKTKAREAIKQKRTDINNQLNEKRSQLKQLQQDLANNNGNATDIQNQITQLEREMASLKHERNQLKKSEAYRNELRNQVTSSEYIDKKREMYNQYRADRQSINNDIHQQLRDNRANLNDVRDMSHNEKNKLNGFNTKTRMLEQSTYALMNLATDENAQNYSDAQKIAAVTADATSLILLDKTAHEMMNNSNKIVKMLGVGLDVANSLGISSQYTYQAVEYVSNMSLFSTAEASPKEKNNDNETLQATDKQNSQSLLEENATMHNDVTKFLSLGLNDEQPIVDTFITVKETAKAKNMSEEDYNKSLAKFVNSHGGNWEQMTQGEKDTWNSAYVNFMEGSDNEMKAMQKAMELFNALKQMKLQVANGKVSLTEEQKKAFKTQAIKQWEKDDVKLDFYKKKLAQIGEDENNENKYFYQYASQFLQGEENLDKEALCQLLIDAKNRKNLSKGAQSLLKKFQEFAGEKSKWFEKSYDYLSVGNMGLFIEYAIQHDAEGRKNYIEEEVKRLSEEFMKRYSMGAGRGGGGGVPSNSAYANTKQTENWDCGITTIYNIARTHGLNMGLEDFKEMLREKGGLSGRMLSLPTIREILARDYNIHISDYTGDTKATAQATVDRLLAQGKGVGLYHDTSTAGESVLTSRSHYVLITGKNADGTYNINDPNGNNERSTYTADELFGSGFDDLFYDEDGAKGSGNFMPLAQPPMPKPNPAPTPVKTPSYNGEHITDENPTAEFMRLVKEVSKNTNIDPRMIVALAWSEQGGGAWEHGNQIQNWFGYDGGGVNFVGRQDQLIKGLSQTLDDNGYRTLNVKQFMDTLVKNGYVGGMSIGDKTYQEKMACMETGFKIAEQWGITGDGSMINAGGSSDSSLLNSGGGISAPTTEDTRSYRERYNDYGKDIEAHYDHVFGNKSEKANYKYGGLKYMGATGVDMNIDMQVDHKAVLNSDKLNAKIKADYKSKEIARYSKKNYSFRKVLQVVDEICHKYMDECEIICNVNYT